MTPSTIDLPVPFHPTAAATPATDVLFDLLYGELRARAHAILRDHGATLQPTALVHEAWLKLVPGKRAAFADRQHFLRCCATAMRSVVIDHARAQKSQKRGGNAERHPLDGLCTLLADRALDLIALDSALARLAACDPELAQIVELRFFAGLEVAAVADALAVSPSTIERGWRTARTWLRAELGVA